MGVPLTLRCHPSAPGKDPEEVQVHDTDYSVFALMLSRRRSGGQSVLTVSLLCECLAGGRK